MRIEATFFGQVQGVGFRYTVFRIATSLSANGFVQNRPDGSVFLVLEGPEDALDKVISEVERRFGGYISEACYNSDKPPEGLSSFEIRYH